MTGGITTGTINMNSETAPTTARTWEVDAESGTLNMVILGVIRNTTGVTAIVATTKRFRRKSRTSLRTTILRAARSRVRLDVAGDELEIHIFERVLWLGEREQIGTGRDHSALLPRVRPRRHH